jgi:hypothetical protein
VNAREVFVARLNRIAELSASIEEFAGLLAGIEDLNWGHVGTLGHVEQELAEIHRVMDECVQTWR